MTYTTKSGPCALTCWVLAVLAAGVAVLLLRSSTAFIILLPIALVVCAVAGYLLKALLCKADETPVAQAAAAPAPAPARTPEPTPAPVKAATPVSEPRSEAVAAPGDSAKPEMLTGPRDGGADDLKQIKGVGPKLEKMLNEMGFYHFDQISNWSTGEVAWVDDNLQGFKGRVSRDNWVEQAKILASGGETEFSKRVEGGDVY